MKALRHLHIGKLGFLFLLTAVLFAPAASRAEESAPASIKLWELPADKIPAADRDPDPQEPLLYPFLPDNKETGRTAVLVVPGGGYSTWVGDKEGFDVAKFLNSHGIAAFVLRYRHTARYQFPAPFDDITRAMQVVRSRAAEFGVDPQRIGVMGFSAGGHLAALLSARYQSSLAEKSNDALDEVSARPDFTILVYPVMTFMNEDLTHRDSRTNFTGDRNETFRDLSPEQHVNAGTPPAFLVHGGRDTLVQPENSIMYYLACKREGVKAELHIFQDGDHGFYLGKATDGTDAWPGLMLNWMTLNGWLPKK